MKHLKCSCVAFVWHVMERRNVYALCLFNLFMECWTGRAGTISARKKEHGPSGLDLSWNTKIHQSEQGHREWPKRGYTQLISISNNRSPAPCWMSSGEALLEKEVSGCGRRGHLWAGGESWCEIARCASCSISLLVWCCLGSLDRDL